MLHKFSKRLIGFSAFGIGSKTKLLAKSDGCFDGIGGGFMWFSVLVLSEKEMSKGPPDRFVKISAQRTIAETLNSKTGRADEGPQIPRQLRPEKKIAAEPTT